MIEHNALWDFSLSVYSDKRVEVILLELQEQYGVDINMVLACLWMASNRRELTRPQCQLLQQSCLSWQQDCVMPLRNVRRTLKDRTGTEAMYQKVKQLELESERWQQDLLFEMLREGGALQVAEAPRDLARRYLQFYSELLVGVDWNDMRAEVEGLIAIIGWVE
jgi:uncharacterized protein (TIGR02444 family)